MPEDIDQNVRFGHDAGMDATPVLSLESLEKESTSCAFLASVEESTEIRKVSASRLRQVCGKIIKATV